MSGSQDNIIIDYGSAFIKSGFCVEKYPTSVLPTNFLMKSQGNSFPNTYDNKKKEVHKMKEFSTTYDKNSNVYVNTSTSHIVNKNSSKNASINNVNNNSANISLNNNLFNHGSNNNLNNNNNASINFNIQKSHNKDGLIEDWDYLISCLSYIFDNELKAKPEEYNILFAEPANNTPKNRETLYEIIFENFNAKACYLATDSILSVFAAGKSTGICVDAGEFKTNIMPVYEGYGIKTSLVTMNIGGRDFNEYLLKILTEKGIKFNNFSESQKRNILTEIKEKHCYVSNDYETDMQNFSKNSESITPTEYLLPDQNVIKLSAEKFRCAEIFFKPSLYPKLANFDEGIHDNINKLILSMELKKEDEEEEKIKKEFYSNIILSGGASMFSSLPERIVSETTKLSGLNYCDVIAIPERKYATWIGGSILSTISIFQSLWITKDDYDDYGTKIINQKLF